MKSVLLFSFVYLCIVVVQSHEDMEEFEVNEACLKSVGLTEDELKSLPNLTSAEVKDKQNDEMFDKFGCYLACVMKENGMIKDSKLDGANVDAEIKKTFKNKPKLMEQFHQQSKKCMGEVEQTEDECALALEFTTCVMENIE